MKLTSTAFQHSQAIPPKYTCDGENVSPQLIISEVPSNAKSLALVCDDPDAPVGTFVHWVAWNIPPNASQIPENHRFQYEGVTDFGRKGWGGPCPPSGTHRYFFKLYALDALLNLPPTARKKDLENAMKGHILAEAQLMGNYKRN
ncbi:YbhB/YbcL family Raf kinase inhibitor-like protein [Candidatus Woesearchaeota archaeon]|nr:YbhB/YbcL family Raf kinase inhibitor-like protein [Candidatus Woesearchaeota archaeon]MBI2660847.1 YbhB/YbcL family Raf kinase inhibitor-like protein [Candidatus Woesearchaeota archaeon]